jgi:integrase
VVLRYKVDVLEQAGYSSSSINLRLCAIRKFADEAQDNGILPANIAAGIARVKGVTKRGVRSGNWLTKEQTQNLLRDIDTDTLKGKRDLAILAVLVGCGLRRKELVNLTFENIQMRDNRWCIVDITGKGGRIRTVPMPAWTKNFIDTWATAAGISTGKVFRGVYRYGKTLQDTGGISDQVIYKLVRKYSHVSPHDLRRTFAKLAYRGGAPIEQIQFSLGHSSINVTQGYLGSKQDLSCAPCDVLGITF